jgi:hypothetical protein
LPRPGLKPLDPTKKHGGTPLADRSTSIAASGAPLCPHAGLGRAAQAIDVSVMFTVEDIDDTLARLGKWGAILVGEVVEYENTYRLCYVRGPEGILIGLAQELASLS